MKLTPEEKQKRILERRKIKHLKKEIEHQEQEKNQKPIKNITMSITWIKSKTWGHNPRLEAKINYKDGTSTNDTCSCSGCGYDKESTVISDIFNRYLKYALWNKGKADNMPYGIAFRSKYTDKDGFEDLDYCYFEGGIGTSCYSDISKYIGGTFSHVFNGKSVDVYQLTF